MKWPVKPLRNAPCSTPDEGGSMSMLSSEWILAFTVFAMSMSISPGPNNLMIMASSSSFGLVRTLPLMFGVSIGWLCLLMIASFGVAGVIEHAPSTHVVLKAIGALYLLYLAIR